MYDDYDVKALVKVVEEVVADFLAIENMEDIDMTLADKLDDALMPFREE